LLTLLITLLNAQELASIDEDTQSGPWMVGYSDKILWHVTLALGRAMFLPAKRRRGYVKQRNETRGLDYRADCAVIVSSCLPRRSYLEN